MATKRRKNRTPAEEAELRISEWKRNDRTREKWDSSANSFTVDGYASDLSDLIERVKQTYAGTHYYTPKK